MATVLKSSSPEHSAPAARKVMGLAGFNLDDLADQGREKLRETQREIERLLANAEVEAERLRATAKAEGHAEGLRQAEAEVESRVRDEAASLAEQQVAMMKQATTELHQTYETWMQQYASLLQTTVIAAVQKIVRQRLAEDRSLIVRWTEDALQSTRSATRLTVAVHPETLAELGQNLDELVAAGDFPEDSRVVPDETLGRNDLVVRQSGGEIQAGLEAQINRLGELLS